MRILHYALGFPPYRSGGLTKFAMDLMEEQARQGHEVALLWPGEMRLFNKKVVLRKNKPHEKIKSFELINPLPISYDEGIDNIENFTKTCDSTVFKSFLEDYKPDVIHIHTFMGLYKEFIEAANVLSIRTVFTVHDFFAICPKVTMFREGRICASVETCEKCPKCNMTALSEKKIFVLQSLVYRTLKNNILVKKLRKRHRDNYLSGEAEATITSASKNAPENYKHLRNYYGEMIDAISVIHYNSTITKAVFERFFQPKATKVIPITHGDIKDCRKIKKFNDVLRFTYLGPQSGAKGFFLLKEVLDDLWAEGTRFRLNIYFIPMKLEPYMIVHDRYSYDELEQIMDETDLLICPSIWYETFGYTVLEALSCGVPVLVSDTVGAKDLISIETGIVYTDKADLYNKLKTMNTDLLSEINKGIVAGKMSFKLSDMTQKIILECYGVK